MRRAALALLLLVPFAASAVEPYAGVNLTRVGYDEEGFPTVYPLALTLKAGAELTPNFAVEGRLATGLANDGFLVSGTTIDIEVDYYYGVYAKGILPLGTFAPYGIIGYTKGELTASGGGASFTDDDSGASFGIGVDAQLTPTLGLNLEFAQLLDEEGYEVNSLSAGFVFRF